MAPLYVRSTRRTSSVAQAVPAAVFRARGSASSGLPFGLPPPPAGAPQLPAGISLCMIVKDEERFLEACLRSAAPAVDEICIVDTGSSDRTIQIARSFDARVELRPWRRDFAWARNEALALATKRWILVLDADEELDGASVEILRSLREVPAHLSGLWVRCNNLSDDYKGTGISSHALTRVFPNSARIRYISPVHEFITLDGQKTGIEACVSALSITHHGYLSEVVKSRNKSQRNLELVKTATRDDPQEPFNWYNLGTTSLLCDQPDAAITAFEKMRVMVGDTQRGFIPNALAQLADLYTDRGDYDRAITAANESLSKAPNYANAHFALGRALAKAKRFDEARTAFEAAIADAPHSKRQFIVDDEVCTWKAHSEIGSSYGQEGDNIKALEWFDRALRNRPNVIPVRMNRAKALERLGRYDEAEAMFEQLASDEPGDAHSVDYINFLLRMQKFTTAAFTIERVLDAVTPRARASLLVMAAQLVSQTGQGNVRSLLERAVTAYPGAADALDALEAVYIAEGDSAALDKLHELECDAPMAVVTDYRRRANLYLRGGRSEAAESTARAGLALDRSDAALHYALASALVQTGRKLEALDELEAARGEGDVGLRALFLRSIVLADLGRREEALASIDAVIALAPREVDARLQRFRLAQALGRDAQAEQTLRDALDLGDPRVAAEFAAWLLAKGRFAEARSVADHALAAV